MDEVGGLRSTKSLAAFRPAPQNITHCQMRITAQGTTDFAGCMRCTISPHVENHLAAPIRFGVVHRCMSSAVVAGLSAVRRSHRYAGPNAAFQRFVLEDGLGALKLLPRIYRRCWKQRISYRLRDSLLTHPPCSWLQM
jgi:hypothetical protein